VRRDARRTGARRRGGVSPSGGPSRAGRHPRSRRRKPGQLQRGARARAGIGRRKSAAIVVGSAPPEGREERLASACPSRPAERRPRLCRRTRAPRRGRRRRPSSGWAYWYLRPAPREPVGPPGRSAARTACSTASGCAAEHSSWTRPGRRQLARPRPRRRSRSAASRHGHLDGRPAARVSACKRGPLGPLPTITAGASCDHLRFLAAVGGLRPGPWLTRS